MNIYSPLFAVLYLQWSELRQTHNQYEKLGIAKSTLNISNSYDFSNLFSGYLTRYILKHKC